MRARLCECGQCSRCKKREYMRAWYWRNRDQACETARRTRARHGDKIRADDRKRGFRVYDMEKVAARSAVKAEIEAGRMTRGFCEVCGVAKVDAHHDDYSRPLDVRWLCRRHHGEVHRRPAPTI